MAESSSSASGQADGAIAERHFSVDASGNGKGLIESHGDVYEGQFRRWQRHGRGEQSWQSGERFIGQWKNDVQYIGVFTDKQGREWVGNFVTKDIRLRLPPVDPRDQSETAHNDTRIVIDGRTPPVHAAAADAKHGDTREVNAAAPALLTQNNVRAHNNGGSSRSNPATAHAHTQSSRTARSRRNRPRALNKSSSRRSNGSNTSRVSFSSRASRNSHYTRPVYKSVKRRDQERAAKRLKMLQKFGLADKDGNIDLDAQFEDMEVVGAERFKYKTKDYRPGPGQYNPEKSVDARIKSVPRFSMGLKAMSVVDQHVRMTCGPGPAYDMDVRSAVEAHKPGTTFGKRPTVQAEMLVARHRVLPGPSQYRPKITASGKSVEFGANASSALFGTSSAKDKRYLGKRRMGGNLGEFSPGPGAYFPQMRRTARTAKINGRVKDLIKPIQKSTDPGPGSFDPSYAQVGNRAPSDKTTVFSKSKRHSAQENLSRTAYDPVLSQTENLGLFSPGPAAYSVDDRVVKKNNNCVSFAPFLRFRAKRADLRAYTAR